MINRYILLLCAFLSVMITETNTLIGQTAWSWETLDSIPFRISNNAVAYGESGGEGYVYSFGGMDSSKVFTGITNRSFRYQISADTWEEIDPIPFESPVIASSASTVDNIIYIIGGYEVFEGGGEASTNEVIRYDPTTNTYLENGASIPVPIDDQVQCTWRDSLIYVITGWSNTGNVPDVQIYNPYLDSWTAGSPTPNTNDYKAFGASGYIIGDTIYYYGGASSGIDFPARDLLRKGVIDPVDPTNISWSLETPGPNTVYRAAAVNYADQIFWIGGSSTSYNYNGIAYDGSGGVSPRFMITRYDHLTDTWYEGSGAPYGVMDLRNAAKISPTQWVICGGMEPGQYVSSRTFLLTYDPVVGAVYEEDPKKYYALNNRYLTFYELPEEVKLYGLNGQLMHVLKNESGEIPDYIQGHFILSIQFAEYTIGSEIVLTAP